MDSKKIIRAWKDPAYRASLSAAEQAELPDSPSGTPLTELGDDALDGVAGGIDIQMTPPVTIYLCRPTYRFICPPRTHFYLCFPTTVLETPE